MVMATMTGQMAKLRFDEPCCVNQAEGGSFGIILLMNKLGSGVDAGSIVNSDKGSNYASEAATSSAIARGTPRGATVKIIQTCQSSAVTYLLQSV